MAPHPDGRRFRYRELADALIPYVGDMGYTHIELMPITEHPLDESWGYQSHRLFRATQPLRQRRTSCAPSSTAAQRRASASSSTGCRDIFRRTRSRSRASTAQRSYEHEDPRLGLHPDWGTHTFNYGRNEVQELPAVERALLAVADSISTGCASTRSRPCSISTTARTRRPMDARTAYGGNENLEAVEFLRALNIMVHGEFPGTLRSPRNRPRGRWCRGRSTSAASALR